jgi:hypothetical protein
MHALHHDVTASIKLPPFTGTKYCHGPGVKVSSHILTKMFDSHLLLQVKGCVYHFVWHTCDCGD